jgi:NAD(P)-dependent dehydrogenase (short-subunit alcohol dehydrogenase family)
VGKRHAGRADYIFYDFSHQKLLNMLNLQNKKVIITGGAGAIGKQTAGRFLEEGASVLLVDLKEDDLEKTVSELKSDKVSYVAADVTKGEDVKKYAQLAEERMGGVDVFFNNAGIEGSVAPLVDMDVDVLDKVLAVNVRGVWLGMKYVMPKMKNGGSIIISSSVAGLRAFPGMSPYVTSKHAVIGIMRTAAVEGAAQGIRVNCINPGPVESRMMRSLEKGFNPDNPEEAKEGFKQRIPLQRYVETDDVARVVLYLSSELSGFVTGQIHPIDGGQTVT